MEYFALIIICPLVGFIIARTGILPRDAHKGVNAWVLYFALPAMFLRLIPTIEWDTSMLVPITGPLLVWFGAILFVYLFSLKRKMDSPTRIALIACCGLGNTGFLGYPMTSAFYGVESLHVAVVFDMCTFLIFCTLGIITILRAAGAENGSRGIRPLLKRMFGFPPFVAGVIALAVPPFMDISFIYPLLDMIVPTVAPLALFAIGLQLEFKDYGESIGFLSAGLLYKLLIAPLMVLLLSILLGAAPEISRVSVLEAGMSAHITMSLMASQFNQNPRLCGLLVASGIILCLFTSALWWFVTGLLF